MDSVGCVVGNFGGSGSLDVSGGCGCLGVVSGEWKHKVGGGDAGCFGVELGSGFQ